MGGALERVPVLASARSGIGRLVLWNANAAVDRIDRDMRVPRGGDFLRRADEESRSRIHRLGTDTAKRSPFIRHNRIRRWAGGPWNRTLVATTARN